MDSFLKKYKHLLFFPIIFLATTGDFYAQETQQDSILLVKKYKKEATTAISNQNYDEAVIKFNEASKLLFFLDDNSLKIEVYWSNAELHYSIQNYKKASLEIKKTLSLLKKTNNNKKLAEANALYGSILTQLGNYKDAEFYLKEADKTFTQLEDERNKAKILLAMGVLELKKENYSTALNYFDAAIPIFNSFKITYEEAFSQLYKAEALLNLNNDEANNNHIAQANLALERAIKIIESNNFPKLKIESYKISSLIAINENKVFDAQKFIQLYSVKKDSLYQVYFTAISNNTDADLNLGELTQLIATQQNDLDKKKRSINLNKMTTGLSIALIIILSLLTLSLYKNNNLRAKANDLLQDKNTELQLAKEKAEKASLAKAQFLSTITHELRTPLYAVTGLTHLLMEEDPLAHQKEHLNSLKFSGDYLLSLINNILDLNKLEANKVEIEKTTFNLQKRISDVLIALKKSADDRKNKINLEFDETIPNKLIGDSLKLSQVLINLISNSLKFTQNGAVTVRVQKLDQKENKVMLHFEIEDNGVGISKKKQKSIFETFSQASLQINRKFGGTGLGLSIVKNLLELMGSKIQLESQLGKGSTFWFNISFGISEELKDEETLSTALQPADYRSLENKNILIVEDNKINQMITKKILEKNKIICMVADNGMDAIDLVKKHEFDLILMDIHMPGISGVEATQKIRTFNKDIPIIALTAVTIDENLDDFYRAGFNEIIPKPFKTEEFFEKIYRTIESRNISVDE